jgi:hypothetical protein
LEAVLSFERPIPYTGDELRSLWIYETFGIRGDAIAVFAGPCEVPTESLVDTKDRIAEETIVAASMLHIIIEHFDASLECAILRQRLLVTIIRDALTSMGVDDLERRGDDIYVSESKLTVSIATKSPVSTLIHTGINIDATGAPVEACGLVELEIEPTQLAESIAMAYCAEMDSAALARTKVRGVR